MEEEELARTQSKAIAECIAPLQASIRDIELLSQRIPAAEDFHFFSNFEGFRSPVVDFQARTQALLSELGMCKQLRSEVAEWPGDVEESYDWLVSVQDDILEGVGSALDEMGVRPGNGPPDFLLDKGKNAAKYASEMQFVKVASKRKSREGRGGGPIPFHVKSLARPQDKFDYPVDNSNKPFKHLSRAAVLGCDQTSQASIVVSALEMHAKNLGVMDVSSGHPLEEELNKMAFLEECPARAEPLNPKPLSETPFTFVETLSALESMAAKLQATQEIAVDLENHHYRSFQGFVCLMQLSTRSEDFVVDTLTLRDHVGPVLRSAFANPSIQKVIHGSDHDILWLQRDFGIYICNMFDTGQAARVLQMESFGLAYLLQTFCGVHPDKRYQLADWRLRPLTAEMLRYAREDTHYLLYIADKLKMTLRDGQTTDNLYVEVCKRSRDKCLQLYEKELHTENSYQHLSGLAVKNFGPEQLAIVAGLYAWRDRISRKEDESTGYVLPNNLLLRLAEMAPDEPKKLQTLLKGGHPIASFHIGEIMSIIKEAKSAARKDPPVLLGRDGTDKSESKDQTTAQPTAKTSTEPATKKFAASVEKGTSSSFFMGATLPSTLAPVAAQASSLLQVQLKRSAVAEALFKPSNNYSDGESDGEETLAKAQSIRASVALPFRSTVKAIIKEFEEEEIEEEVKPQEEIVEEAKLQSPAEQEQEREEEQEQEQEPNNAVEFMSIQEDDGNKPSSDLPPSLNERYGGKKVGNRQRRQYSSHCAGKKLKRSEEEKAPQLLPAFHAKTKTRTSGKVLQAFDPARNALQKPEGIKAGKRRQVFPLSGNRTATFK